MKFKEEYKKYSGHLQIRILNSKGEIERIVDQPNIITYSASNILAHTLSGNTDYKISHILAGGSEEAHIPLSMPTVSREDIVLHLQGEETYKGSGYYGVYSDVIVELPIITPVFAANPVDGAEDYQTENMVSFFGIMPGVVPSGYPDFQNKFFYESGLIVNFGTSYVLFSHLFHTPIQKLENFQLVYIWNIRFK